ncbi:MAG TPA: caspase family protein [Stenomitos sp.]
MPRIKRRQFLQFTSSTLAALGLSQLHIQRQGDRYAKVLAQSTPRKLALLVGINNYLASLGSLQGCLTDVDLQRQLLINKFGFHPKDILTVTDGQATRQGMLMAFEEHLIKQAKPGDVVVFHFSGHGSRVVNPDSGDPDKFNSTMVPIDRPADSVTNSANPIPDIMGHTLFLLMSALQTENVTVVLDCCYAGGGTRGNFVVRSSSSNLQLQASPAEFEYQRQWLSRLNLSPQEFIQRRRAGIAKGAVIAAATRDQLAADIALGDNFFCGAFTYWLTQYLWQQTRNEPLGSVMTNVASRTQYLARSSGLYQTPVLEVKLNSNYTNRPAYFVEQQMPPAEAVILGVEGERAQVWLGGINPESLAAFDKGAVLSVVDSKGNQKGQVHLESRQGLKGQGKLLGTAQPGALLQEQVRGIPSNVTLTIGLDPSLSKDTQAAKQVLEAIKHIEAVPLHQKEVQYILGRMTDAYQQDWQRQKVANIPPVGSVGLFSPGLELIPNSFGVAGETGTQAVSRLQSKLRALLAARLVKLTLNTDSSRLNVTASMSREDGQKLVASAFTVRGSVGKGSVANRPIPELPSNITKLPLGTCVQFQINNNENRDLYLSLLVIDPTGEMSVIFPDQWTATDDVMRVKAGQTIQIPDPNEKSFSLVTQEPLGVAEVLIIASATPLRRALQALRTVAAQGGTSRGAITPDEPTEVIGNLLEDLAEGTRGAQGVIPAQFPDVKRIDTSQMATMSITFEVI